MSGLTILSLPREVLTLVARAFLDICPHGIHHADGYRWSVLRCEHVRDFALVCRPFLEIMKPLAWRRLSFMIGEPEPGKRGLIDWDIEANATRLRHVRVLSVFCAGSSLTGAEASDVSEPLSRLVNHVGRLEALELAFVGSDWADSNLDGVFESLCKIPRVHRLTLASSTDWDDVDFVDMILRLTDHMRVTELQLQGTDATPVPPVLRDHHLARIARIANFALCRIELALRDNVVIPDSKTRTLTSINTYVHISEFLQLAKALGSSLEDICIEPVIDGRSPAPLQELDLPHLTNLRIAAHNFDGELRLQGSVYTLLNTFAQTRVQGMVLICEEDEIDTILCAIAEWFSENPRAYPGLMGLHLRPPENSGKSLGEGFTESAAWGGFCTFAESHCVAARCYQFEHLVVSDLNRDKWAEKLDRRQSYKSDSTVDKGSWA